MTVMMVICAVECPPRNPSAIIQERLHDVVRVSYTRGKTGKPVKQFLVIFDKKLIFGKKKKKVYPSLSMSNFTHLTAMCYLFPKDKHNHPHDFTLCGSRQICKTVASYREIVAELHTIAMTLTRIASLAHMGKPLKVLLNIYIGV